MVRLFRAGVSLGRVIVVAIFAVIALQVSAGVAAAHTGLASSDPADGAAIAQAPAVVTLTFEQEIVDLGATVVVSGPDGAPLPVGAPTVEGAVVRAEVPTWGSNGAYTLGFRVVSADGHAIEGQIGFQLEVPPPPPPTTPTTPTTRPTSTAAPSPVTASTPSATATTPSPSPTVSSSAAQPDAPATVSSADVASTASSDGNGPSWWWVVVALGVAAAVGAVIVAARRRARAPDRA